MTDKKTPDPNQLFRELLQETAAVALPAQGTERRETAQSAGPPPVELDPGQFKSVQQQAISLLASLRPTEVARRLQVGRRTLHTWMRDPQFNRAVAAEVARRQHDLRQTTEAGFHAAVDAARELLDSDSPDLRLRAASVLLRHCAPRQELRGPDDQLGDLRAAVERLAEELRQRPSATASSAPRWNLGAC